MTRHPDRDREGNIEAPEFFVDSAVFGGFEEGDGLVEEFELEDVDEVDEVLDEVEELDEVKGREAL